MSSDAMWCPVPQCVTRTNDLHDHLFTQHDEEELTAVIIHLMNPRNPDE